MINYKKLKITGMSCAHCEKTVGDALIQVPEVEKIKRISWETGEAIIKTSGLLNEKALAKQIKKSGYKLVEVSPLESADIADNKTDFDVVIIGAGSAGFAAAIRAAEEGKSAALIEEGTIGGTCVNVGCVPSKYIISEAFSDNTWNFIAKGRDRLIESLRKDKYIHVLENYGKNVTYFHETAQFINADSVRLSNGIVITGKKYILTTGSKPFLPNIPGIAILDPLNSTGILFTDTLPKSLIIIGGRFIALELGQAFARLGVTVTILQRSSRLIPQFDAEISSSIEKVFTEQGITVITGTAIIDAFLERGNKGIRYTKNGEEKSIAAEQIVLATGRAGNTESLNLSAAGVDIDKTKHIRTDEYLRTSNPDIFAAGDVCTTPGLVYVAAKEGQTAVSNAFSPVPVPLSYNAVPHVIFTHPQIAQVGQTEREAQNAGIHTAVSRFPMEETPYGLANNDTGGTIILVKNAETDILIGAEILAKDAGNMIQTLTVAIAAQMTVKNLINTYFPYLTAVEGIKLGALVFDKDIHSLSCCAG